MTSPHDDLLALATAYALHAVDDAERADIDRQEGRWSEKLSDIRTSEVAAS